MLTPAGLYTSCQDFPSVRLWDGEEAQPSERRAWKQEAPRRCQPEVGLREICSILRLQTASDCYGYTGYSGQAPRQQISNKRQGKMACGLDLWGDVKHKREHFRVPVTEVGGEMWRAD